ncbi:MAG: choice-of-anchor B family protein [Bacteroidetes bacterium]|jgi:choice-of-anchor B domain-containing protein|nr:choice-of-anchor B family protein [Bacteroidota bacterium]
MKKIALLAAGITLCGSMLWAQNLNVTFQAQLPNSGNTTLANICGYTDELGNEYALLGHSQGMIVVDVTVPNNPTVVTQIPNVNNLWKEIKVYGDYAYVTTEGSGGALQIVDLSPLPQSSTLPSHFYFGDGAINNQLSTVHALHIDTTKGYCYLFGTNIGQGGAIVLDLNTDPYNPAYAGVYDNLGYVHDGYVDNDTLYASHIYAGYFAIVNMANKANPVVISTQATPTNFTHNTWISDDRKFIFTTDENTNSYLGAYDVSNPNSVTEVDRIQSQFPNSGSVVHNTHILNNWAVTSWYKDGFVITDITRPHNMVNVGWYDTFNGTGNGFEGAWGVFPYFPSGTIVVSNIDEGLFVFSPNYVRACYLEGSVMDSLCGTPIPGVTVTISSVNITEQSNVSGEFYTGTPTPGTYTVTFSKPGYVTKTFTNVVFAPGQVNLFNINMYAPGAVNLTGTVDDTSSTALPGSFVLVENANNIYNFVADNNGDFSSCNVISDEYDITSGLWGYQTICYLDSVNQNNPTLNLQLNPGYYDDFTFDFGWTISGTATAGTWERGIPVGTTYNTLNDANPGVDATGDCSRYAYVTGNGGGNVSSDDVDGGSTTLRSPVMNLTTYNDPWIHYSRWFFNDGGSGNPNDSLVIRLTDGFTTVTLEKVTANTPNNSSWVRRSFRVSDYFTPNANMRVIVETADLQPGHLVEAGFDHFLVVDSNAASVPVIRGNDFDVVAAPSPFGDFTTIQFNMGNSFNGNALLTVTDISGRIVETVNVTTGQGQLNIGSGLAEGIYVVRITSGNSNAILRIVKSK